MAARSSGWTMPVCEIDLRVGGKYRYVWRHAQGHEMGMGGVFREIVPPERIVSTEKFDEAWYPGEESARSSLPSERNVRSHRELPSNSAESAVALSVPPRSMRAAEQAIRALARSLRCDRRSVHFGKDDRADCSPGYRLRQTFP